MGRGKASKRPRRAPRNTKKDTFIGEDMDDDVDAFHKQRDVIPLDANAQYSDSDDDEHPVFDLEVDDGSEDNSMEVEEEEKEDDDDVQLQPNKFAAKIARQAKYLKEKFGALDDEMNDSDEHEEDKKTVWGRSKNLYYSADNVDYELQSSEEDEPVEEEAEVLKIQRERAKFLQLEDFGFGSVEGDSGYDGQDVLGFKNAKKRTADSALGESTLDIYEDEFGKDLNSLSKEELADVLNRSAPELVGLLSEMREAVVQLKKVNPLLDKVRIGGLVSNGVREYLEVKQMLLLTYCQGISFYLLLKSEGHTVRDHPVIARLVEIKTLMEKIKQVDAKFPSGIEDYIAGEVGSELADKDHHVELSLNETATMSNKPPVNLQDEVNKTCELDVNASQQCKEAPIQKVMNDRLGIQSKEMLKIRANIVAKLNQRGLNNMKDSRPDRTFSATLKPRIRHLVTSEDFDDDVQQTARSNVCDKNVWNKISKLVASKGQKYKFVSGDDDLPMRDDIGERRRKHELRVLARAGAEPDDEEVRDDDVPVAPSATDMDVQSNGVLIPDSAEEQADGLYKEVKKQRTEELDSKSENFFRNSVVPPPFEEEANGKRQITYQMEKNRGLTRNRKKLIKNPRKKYKLKHQKAVIRRKGQVRDVRKPDGPYSGEATGINPGISHSIRFKN